MRLAMPFLLAATICSSCGLFDSGPNEPETIPMPSSVVQEFEQACRQLLTEHPSGIPGCFPARDGWVLEGNELRYGRSGPFFGENATEVYPDARPGEADPMGAILHFRDQLEARGIELVMIPIPVRPVIYPESVMNVDAFRDAVPFPHVKPMQDDFMRLLRENGVHRINLTPYFLKNRHHALGPLYCRSDTHWSPVAAYLAAEILGEFVKSRRWFAAALEQYGDPEQPFTAEWLSLEHFGHIFKTLQENSWREPLEAEKLAYRKISGPGIVAKSGEGFRHRSAPVLVIGDSNVLWWFKQCADFPSQLSYELGFNVDAIITRGGGINEGRLNLVREVRSNPQYLEGKKLVVWIFSARSVLGAQPSWIRTTLGSV